MKCDEAVNQWDNETSIPVKMRLCAALSENDQIMFVSSF